MIINEKIHRLHFLNVRKTPEPTGVEKVASFLLSEFKKNKSLEVIEDFLVKNESLNIFLNSTNLLRKLVYLVSFLFYFTRLKSNKSEMILFSVTGRLPPFLPKYILKAIVVHDLIYKKVAKTQPFLGNLSDKILLPLAIKNSDIIFVLSQSTADDIAFFFPKHKSKIKIISLASTLTHDRFHINKINKIESYKYILSVGTIEPRKNYLRLLEAYSRLPGPLKESFRLIIVGRNGWGRINLDNEIHNLNLSNQVIQKSYVDDIELISLYKNAYCLIMPSLYEGFGLPIIEAQSFGVPVITSNISSMPEVAGDGALFLNPYSTEDMTQVLKKLLSDESLRNILSQKAKSNERKYNWKKTTQQIVEVLLNC